MNRRRKTDLLESISYVQANPMPEISRAHRDCEMECIELKSRVGQMEELLARCGLRLYDLSDRIEDEFSHRDDETDQLVAEIDAILPATEGKKDEHRNN